MSIKLDIACGQNKQEGYLGIDIAGGPDVDMEHDLLVTPWPVGDNEVSHTFSSHFAEHIPHYRPEFKGLDGWWVFFNELYRVCEPDAECIFIHPYVKSDRSFWDPTHTRFIHETTWYYLNQEWREMNKLDHYDAECNFEVVTIQGLGIAEIWQSRNSEAQRFAANHYWNYMADLQVTLKAIK